MFALFHVLLHKISHTKLAKWRVEKRKEIICGFEYNMLGFFSLSNCVLS